MTQARNASQTKPAVGKRVRFALVALFGPTSLSGCFDPGFDCLTLDEYERIAASKPELTGIIERISAGEIVTESPTPWLRNANFTGEACTVEVTIRDGSAFASVSFLDEPVELKVPIAERDFYVGLVDRNEAVIVQQIPGGTTAAAVPFADDGTLEYGACRKFRSRFRDCHVAPENQS